MENLQLIKQLEQRILKLEQFMSNINFGEKSDIHIVNCPIATIDIAKGCNLSFDSSSAGRVMQGDINDAENRADDLECRIEDIKCLMSDLECGIEDIKCLMSDLECGMEDIKCLMSDAGQRIEDMKENAEDD